MLRSGDFHGCITFCYLLFLIIVTLRFAHWTWGCDSDGLGLIIVHQTQRFHRVLPGGLLGLNEMLLEPKHWSILKKCILTNVCKLKCSSVASLSNSSVCSIEWERACVYLNNLPTIGEPAEQAKSRRDCAENKHQDPRRDMTAAAH